MKYSYIFIALLILFSACQQANNQASEEKPSNTQVVKSVDKTSLTQEIAKVENDLYNTQSFSFNAQKAKKVVEAYNQYTTAFPKDAKTPEYLFKSAEIYRSLKQYRKAVETYQNIHSNYPNFEKTPHSLFLMGFSYENDLKNLDEAKKAYQNFLNKYPKHELAKDVNFSLQNLGRAPEEIIKQFEQSKKG